MRVEREAREVGAGRRRDGERDRGYVYLLVEQSAESDNLMWAQADSLKCGVLYQTLHPYSP